MKKKLFKVAGFGEKKRHFILDCLCGSNEALHFVDFELSEGEFGGKAVEYEEVCVYTSGTALSLGGRLHAIWKLLIFGHWDNLGICLDKKSLIKLKKWIENTLAYWESLEGKVLPKDTFNSVISKEISQLQSK